MLSAASDVINRKIKEKNGTNGTKWKCARENGDASSHSSHISSLTTGIQIQIGWHCQLSQADRILTRPVQEIKAGLALMLALLCGDWSGAAWRAGLLLCPVLQLLFSGLRNSSSSMVWAQNQHLSYTRVSHKSLEPEAKQKTTVRWSFLKYKHLRQAQVGEQIEGWQINTWLLQSTCWSVLE